VIKVRSDSRASFHRLAIRASDDEPGTFVVGRVDGGEYVELPAVGVDAIRLLDGGLTVDEVERFLADTDTHTDTHTHTHTDTHTHTHTDTDADTHTDTDTDTDTDADADARPDVAGLLGDLVDLAWVASIDGQRLPDPIGTRGAHLAWLRPVHVRWLFSRPVAACYAVLITAAVVTVVSRPALLPGYRDFFWTDYVGLATLVATLMFFASGAVHELMHLAAARSLGVPARVGLGTRLNNLALQTDVSAAWTVPRGKRYRIYLAGVLWDTAAISVALLVCAHANPSAPVRDLLATYVLVAGVGVVFQAQVYMRTDFFFVLMDVLRCGDLFHDGLRYCRYLGARLTGRMRGRAVPADPSTELPDRERRGVRIYAPLVVLGSAVALATYALVGLPILVETTVRAVSALAAVGSGGSVLRAVDAAIVLAVEWGLQVAFAVTFYRTHPAWFGRGARNGEGGEPDA
jgi:putative peptide zinc metalloprotease protein